MPEELEHKSSPLPSSISRGAIKTGLPISGITPSELALVALNLAERDHLPTTQMFPKAFQLLADAASFLEKRKEPCGLENLSREEAAKVISDFGPTKTWTFPDATEGVDAPLNRLWKSRQGLEQAITRLSDKQIITYEDAERWLRERKLSEVDLELIARAVKVERCGKLAEDDPSLSLRALIETIPE